MNASRAELTLSASNALKNLSNLLHFDPIGGIIKAYALDKSWQSAFVTDFIDMPFEFTLALMKSQTHGAGNEENHSSESCWKLRLS